MALDRIQREPLQFVRLIFRKQAYMWGTSSTNVGLRLRADLPRRILKPLSAGIKASINTGWAALWLLCLIATVRTTAWRNRALRPLVLLLAFTFLLHMLFEVQSRYHIPVMGLLVLIGRTGLADGSMEHACKEPLNTLVCQ